jgi:hypothetical protein
VRLLGSDGSWVLHQRVWPTPGRYALWIPELLCRNAYTGGPGEAFPVFINGWLGSGTSPNGWMTIPLHATGGSTGLNHSLVGGATTLFKPDDSSETRPQATYYGLPVIGFAAESYTNGTLIFNGQPVLSNYRGLIGHRYTVHVE